MQSGNIITDLPRFYLAYHRRLGWQMYVLLGLVALGALLELVALAIFVPVLTGGEASDGFATLLGDFFPIRAADKIGLELQLILTAVVVVVWRVTELGTGACRLNMMGRLLKRMRLRFLDQISSLEYKHFLREKSGELANIMGSQIPIVMGSLGPFFDGLKAFILVIVFVCGAMLVEWRIALGCIVLGAISAPLAAPANRMRQELSKRIVERQGRIQDLFIQLLRNFKYLKATGAGGVVSTHVADEVELVREDTVRNQLGVITVKCVLQAVAALIVLIAIYLLKVPFAHGAAAVIMLTAMIYRGSAAAALMYEKWIQFCSASGAIFIVEEVEERLEACREKNLGGADPDFERLISIENVSLNYDDREILSDVNLTINRHEVVGIAGESGSGKSTLLNILVGLVEPTTGTVKMDGELYAGLDRHQLRKMFGYVTQEPMLFNDTIANNISLWSAAEDDQKLREAAVSTGAVALAERSEAGFGAVIGEQGMQVSGGERQKIALARELFRKKKILILDEATSSLDSRSEEEINKCIHSMQGKQTMVVVAHRLGSLRECTRIYVMSGGRIAESGSWSELVNRENGVFQKLCQAQGVRD